MRSFIGAQAMPSVTVNVTLRPESRTALANASTITERMLDLAPVLSQLPRLVIFPSMQKSFAAGGRPAWHFKGFQSSPPMVKSGLTRHALTQSAPELQNIRVSQNTLTFELNPAPFMARSMHGDWGPRTGGRFRSGFFYPAAHQYGPSESSWHNQNIILNLQEEDIEKMKEIVAGYLADGSVR